MTEVAFNVMKGKDLSVGTTKVLLLKVAPAGCFDPDVATVAALLAVATAAECDFTSYARKTAVVTRTVNNTDNRADFDTPDQTWSPAGGTLNNTPAALVFYHDVDATDANALPISIHSTGFTTPTNGGSWTATVANFAQDS